MTAEKIVLKDFERAYELTLYDIARYRRQAGSITVDVAKRLIRWNYFKNEDAVDLWTHQEEGRNYTIIAMDMFDLQLWILENYDIDIDMLNKIEDELSYFTTIGLNLK